MEISENIISVVALVLSIYVFFVQRKINKKQNTLEYLHRLIVDDKLSDANNDFKYKICSYYRIDSSFHENNMEYFKELNIGSLSDNEFQKYQNNANNKRDINLLLDYFDALAIGTEVGIYDFQTAKLSKSKQIIHTFRCSELHINKTRDELDQPNLFVQLEKFVKKLESNG